MSVEFNRERPAIVRMCKKAHSDGFWRGFIVGTVVTAITFLAMVKFGVGL